MNAVNDAIKTQLANIEKKTGKKLSQLHAAIGKCGQEKHGEIRKWLMEEYDLGYGDANTLAHSAQQKGSPSGDVLAEMYSGKKEHLRPIHDKILDTIKAWGEFEVAPKKGYVSLRRKKQFAMLGPKTNERIELGLNLKHDIASKKIVAQKPGGMCQYIVALTQISDVDKEALAALKKAFDDAG